MIADQKCNQKCKTKNSLHMLLDTAKYKALKYRCHPLLGEIHSQYAEALKSVVEADGGSNA